MCHFPYMANATPEEEIYNPSHSLKFRAIPHGFSTESLCFDFVLLFFMRNDTNPHVGNSSDTIVPHSLLHSEDMFLLARKAEIVIQQNLLLIIRAPTSARPSSELIHNLPYRFSKLRPHHCKKRKATNFYTYNLRYAAETNRHHTGSQYRELPV